MAWRPTTRHRCNRFLSSIRPCLPLISSAREFFLSLSRRGGGRGLSPRSNRFDQQGGGRGGKRSHLGIKLRPPKKDNVSRCSSNTEQSNYSLGFSFSIFPPPPPPPSPAYFRNHWMFTHPIARRFDTTCNRFLCERQFLPLISRSSLPRGSLSLPIRNLLPSSPPKKKDSSHSNPGRAKNRTRLLLATVFASPPSLPAYFRNLWIADVYAATQIQSKSTLDGY